MSRIVVSFILFVCSKYKFIESIDTVTVFEYITRLADAGWSSLVARRAHNPKVVGSNPAPATNFY